MLFHISDKRYLTELTPKVPRTVGNEFTEDSETPRICFSPSINGCLRGVCEEICNSFLPNQYDSHLYVNNYEEAHSLVELIDGSDPGVAMLQTLQQLMTKSTTKYPLYHAYIPIGVAYKEFYVPTQKEVYDQPYTKEVWLKRPCDTRRVFSFIVTGAFPVDSVAFPNPNNGQMVNLTIRDYMIQIVPDKLVDSYLICDETSRQDQIKLWKYENDIKG